MKADKNRRLGKVCVDCGVPIIDRATRCRSCAALRRYEKIRGTRICPQCGKEFHRRPSYGNTGGLYFCSADCRKAYHLIACEQCGNLFRPSRPNTPRKQRFCSRKCWNEYRKDHPVAGQQGRKEFTCEECGKIFSAYASQRSHEHVFCCMECKVAWWRGSNHSGYDSIECVCEVCGTVFERTRYKVEKFGGKYCSRACFAQSQVLPAVDYYGPNWPEQRRKARHRDGYMCRLCGISEDVLGKQLDVHHIVSFRKFGLVRYKEANRLSNLVSLCKSCHRTVERNEIRIPPLYRDSG